jgi:hypothetical protein
MTNRATLITAAQQRGRDYLPVYRGCAHATLCAVADTLDMEVSDAVFRAMTGMSSLAGGCGGLCGAIAAIGLRYGVDHAAFRANPDTSRVWDVVKRVRDQFEATYGGYLCCDVQTRLFGRSFDLFNADDRAAFGAAKPYEICPNVTANAAGWTVAAILDADTEV